MSKTIAVHVRYKYLSISLPSSAKQEREKSKFCIVSGTRNTRANFSSGHRTALVSRASSRPGTNVYLYARFVSIRLSPIPVQIWEISFCNTLIRFLSVVSKV